MNEIGKDLAAALVAFGAEVENVTKDRANPYFKSTYATLGAIIDATRPLLAKHGLVVMQTTGVTDGVVVLRTTLAHRSGQCVEGFYPLKPVKDDPQGYGSAITYARRYCLAAILGITQEDDDGNSASHAPAKHEPAPQQERATAPRANPSGTFTCGFDKVDGKNKPRRKAPQAMTDKELSFALELADGALNDVAKQKYHDDARAARDAVLAEVAERQAVGKPDAEPPF